MRFIADWHIHSKFSRACSKNLTLSNLAAWASTKGIDVLATSDFTHPSWFAEIEAKLEQAEPGLFRLKDKFISEDGDGAYVPAPSVKRGREVRFMLSTEVSCIYKKNGKTRRLHLLVLFPSLDSAKKFNGALVALGCNIRSDGRPILGLEAKEIVRIATEIDDAAAVIPAHAWTPWFSVFGSESGFDSLEECFEERTKDIFALETGLSSDPAMNRRLSALDGIALISNSDAHGVRNLGREANVFELASPSYGGFMEALRKNDGGAFKGTIEFFPEEGKYHVDGHRACDFSCEPEETERRKGICPKCGKQLTRGVLGRVHALADRSGAPTSRESAGNFRSIVPLEEVIAGALGKGKASKAVFAAYASLLGEVGPEFNVLLDAERAEVAAAAGERIADAVMLMREGKVRIRPGFDGVYGEVRIFEERQIAAQEKLL